VLFLFLAPKGNTVHQFKMMRSNHKVLMMILGALAFSLTFLSCVTLPSDSTMGKRSLMEPLKSKTFVFIHGMYLDSTSWKEWQNLFIERGFKTVVPAWPMRVRQVGTDKKSFSKRSLAEVSLRDLLEVYRSEIKKLDEKPILIGHSMGGLIAQVLLQENLAEAGIAISSAPPKGLVSLKWSFLRSNWGAVSPFADPSEPIQLSADQFAYSFTNCLKNEERQAVYENGYQMESRRVGKGPTEEVRKFSKLNAI
jgi:pimeloyl-ACP methyl ester carboxylesterase